MFVDSTVHPRGEINEFAKRVATSGELTQRANRTPVVVNNSGSKQVKLESRLSVRKSMLHDSKSDTGTSLILRLRENETLAWNELLELYAPLVFHWCHECKLQSCDAADVMQEVFSAVSRSIQRFQKHRDGSLRGWLWTITQNQIRDFWRKQNRQAAKGGTVAHWQMNQLLDDINDEPTTELENSRLLHRALEQIENDFQPQTWTAFWRSAIEGHNNAWIAEELAISVNSVRQAKSRVLRRLREQLGEL
jgi:RNA polymerase sigma-70 factor (ECF subfamily)